MNTTETETFALPIPADKTEARDLVTGKTVKLDHPIPVPPLTTVVLHLGR